jgi:hypothetical protein
MIGRDHLVEIKLVEKPILSAHRRTHHRHSPSPPKPASENHPRPSRSKEFFDSLGYKLPLTATSNYDRIGLNNGHEIGDVWYRG